MRIIDKSRWNAFRRWQRKPHQVAPMSDVYCLCATCKTEYQGNFCPRCGQSAKVNRFSFKSAFLHFLDVWGMGNRGMFHSLRDLILRPGYMIRDYLDGMRMAYFPPFKMLFIFTTLALVVNYGFNIKGKPYDIHREESLIYVGDTITDDKKEPELGQKTMLLISNYQHQHPAIVSLLSVILLSVFLYPFFKRMKSRPDIRYSEFLVAIIYTANMTAIYEIFIMFFYLPSAIYRFFPSVMVLLPLKQLSGYSWFATIWRAFVAAILMFIATFIIITLILMIVEGIPLIEEQMKSTT